MTTKDTVQTTFYAIQLKIVLHNIPEQPGITLGFSLI